MVNEKEITRFSFGKNWLAFADQIDPDRLDEAQRSLKSLFNIEDFAGLTFLDIGCGSGLFSLAAIKLGATVVSIDYDSESIECTRKLRDTFDISTVDWSIRQGSILDAKLLKEIGTADLVYCWGVVHHTGSMREAIGNVASMVKGNGSLCLAVYNQQGGASKRWRLIKQTYHVLPKALRPIYAVLIAGWYESIFALARLVKFQNPLPFSDWKRKKKDRGMSPWHDWIDWIGGLPFEVATPGEVLDQLRPSGFVLEKMKTVGGGWGCNEFLFTMKKD